MAGFLLATVLSCHAVAVAQPSCSWDTVIPCWVPASLPRSEEHENLDDTFDPALVDDAIELQRHLEVERRALMQTGRWTRDAWTRWAAKEACAAVSINEGTGLWNFFPAGDVDRAWDLDPGTDPAHAPPICPSARALDADTCRQRVRRLPRFMCDTLPPALDACLARQRFDDLFVSVEAWKQSGNWSPEIEREYDAILNDIASAAPPVENAIYGHPRHPETGDSREWF